MLTPEILRELRTEAGLRLLSRAEALIDEPFAASLLRSEATPELAAAAVDEVRLRRRATSKFRDAHELWFTQPLLEQASGDLLAERRAQRFPSDEEVIDLCCGLGGDAMALARRGPAIAIDRDPMALALCHANCDSRGVEGRLTTLQSDASDLALSPAYIWVDPGRRETGRRTRRLEEMSPRLSELLPVLRSTKGAGLKLSPAADHQELDSGLVTLEGTVQEREFLSVKGECRELALWTGCLAGEFPRRATLLPEGISMEGVPVPLRETAPVGKYLLEPDAAVLRAGLVGNLAAVSGCWGIDLQLSYLSSDSRPESPFGRSYEVGAAEAFSQKALTRALRELGVGAVTLKTRGTAFQPEALQQALRGVLKQGDQSRHAVVFLTRLAGRPVFLLGEALASGRG